MRIFLSDFYQQISSVYPEIFPINTAALNLIKSLPKFGSRLLDLGCGPGDYTTELHRFGYEVEGLDNSAAMISEAQKKSKAKHHLLNMMELSNLNSEFDLIYSIGNSISYLNDFELKGFCNQLHNQLKPEGQVLLQTVNWEIFFIKNTLEFPDKVLNDGRVFKRRYHIDDDENIHFCTSLEAGAKISSWSQILYPKKIEVMERALVSNGFNLIDLYGDYLKTHYNPTQSPAMVWIARRA
jgi:SAM-dependent methyltransferase